MMMTARTFVCMVSLVCALSGCSSVSVTRCRDQSCAVQWECIGPASPRAPIRTPAQVDVVEAGLPDEPCRTIETITVSTAAIPAHASTRRAYLLDKLREAAAQSGADGIMRVRVLKTSSLNFSVKWTGLTQPKALDASRVLWVGEVAEISADAFVYEKEPRSKQERRRENR